MTLTLVLWLRNGRKYAEIAAGDTGVPFYEWCVPVYEPMRLVDWCAHVPTLCEPKVARFRLTDEHAVRMYALGRRRFHYLCTTEWTPEPTGPHDDNELVPPHVRERIEREARVWEATKKQMALLEAGAFPGEQPVMAQPLTIVVAKPYYGKALSESYMEQVTELKKYIYKRDD